MAELLSSFFSEIYRGDVPQNPAPFQSFDGVTAQEVFGLLSGLNVSSAMGLDGLHPRLLRECAEQLSQPLCLVFNLSMQSGLVPDAWRESLVIPIFKGKSRCDPLNYRPVSLTSVCCKLLLLFSSHPGCRARVSAAHRPDPKVSPDTTALVG